MEKRGYRQINRQTVIQVDTVDRQQGMKTDMGIEAGS